MAYRDRRRVRRDADRMRLDDYEDGAVEQLVELEGEQRGALLRKLAMDGVYRALRLHGMECERPRQGAEEPRKGS